MSYNKLIAVFILTLAPLKVFSVERFYYGDLPKFMEVNSRDSMLLSFPSPPLSVSCQPSGVVEINLIENERDLQIPTIAQNPSLLDTFKKGTDDMQNKQQSKVNSPTDLILKLVPIKEEKETRCSISLNNGETVSLRIVPKSGVFRPLVKLESAMSDMNPTLSLSLNYLDIFSELIRGNGISRFEETTKDVSEREKNTKVANYKLLYSSSDRSEYRAWIFQVKLKIDIDTQLALQTSNVGDIYLSSLLRGDITRKGKFKKEEDLNLYILSRNSVSSKELMEKLP